MSETTLYDHLTQFFRAARHLFGRCPSCGHIFRLSDAAISYGANPPRDWLLKLGQQEARLIERKEDLEEWQADLEVRERDTRDAEHDVAFRERSLDRTVKQRAKEMIKDSSQIKKLLTEARRESIQRSRSTLLGNLFERLSPFLQRFRHDPRDVRPIMHPIDYVCFDGLTASRRVERITFVEVKAGMSKVNSAQQSIMEAIQQGRVGVEVWQFGARGIPIEQQLLKPGRERRALFAPID